MSISQRLVIVAAVAAIAAVPRDARADHAKPVSLRTAAGLVPAVRAPITMADAQRLAEEGRYKEAARAFRALASQQRAAGDYPVAALRALADVEFALDDNRGSAAALDELADAASQFGDPETEIRSRFDAALLYQQMGEREAAAVHVPRIKSLLKSPAIAAETRADIASRISPT